MVSDQDLQIRKSLIFSNRYIAADKSLFSIQSVTESVYHTIVLKYSQSGRSTSYVKNAVYVIVL